MSPGKPLARSRLSRGAVALALAGLVAVGLAGTARYLSNFWLYRGFAPPQDPAFVRARRPSGAVLRRERGPRQPAPAGRRLPAPRLRHPPEPALCRHVPAARLSRPARRLLEHCPHGGGRGRPARAKADPPHDPRDAVRLHRHVHGQGVGQRDRASPGLGDVRGQGSRALRSTRASGRSRMAPTASSPGCPRVATVRSTSVCTIRVSSVCSRAGRDTSAPTT